VPQDLIAAAGLRQKQLSRLAFPFQREMKELVNLLPTFGLNEVGSDVYLSFLSD
jgi:hypothetical protein